MSTNNINEAVRDALECYAESYDCMARMRPANTVDCTSVAYDIRKNMVESVCAALSSTPSNLTEGESRVRDEEMPPLPSLPRAVHKHSVWGDLFDTIGVHAYAIKYAADAIAADRRARQGEPVGFLDPVSVSNLKAGRSKREWLWDRPEPGNVAVYLAATKAAAPADAPIVAALERVRRLFSKGVDPRLDAALDDIDKALSGRAAGSEKAQAGQPKGDANE